MTKEKVRVYALARELNMDSKDLLDICRDAGLDLKNQLSSIDPDQRDMIVQLVKGGGSVATAVAPKTTTTAPVIPPVHKKPIRNLDSRGKPTVEEPRQEAEARPAEKKVHAEKRVTQQERQAELAEQPTVQEDGEATAERIDHKAEQALPAEVAASSEAIQPTKSPAETAAESTSLGQPVAKERPDEPPSTGPSTTSPAAPGQVMGPPIIRPPEKKIRDLSAPKGTDKESRSKPRPKVARPAPYQIATPPPVKSPTIKEPKKPVEKKQTPLAPLSPEMLRESQKRPIRLEDILPKKPAGPARTLEELEDEEVAAGKKKKRTRPGPVGDRQARKELREQRAQQRKLQSEVKLEHGRVHEDEDDRAVQVRLRNRRAAKPKREVVAPVRRNRIVIEPPITVRSLSEALGMKSVALLFKLQGLGLPPTTNINTTLDQRVAEELAIDLGCDIEIKRPPDIEDKLLESFEKPDKPEECVPRAPIVTIMGHVDHGKTSLLDRIRKSNIVATEAGGITQVIRAWRVEHDGKPITFLDTPGHEAFTKMRARGAQVTDIAVIVVAADDGVMPQTEEAINHAKAAGVSLVIAINKVDVPNANVEKTRQQLYGLEILPDNMGGDTPFVETSAVTGQGIDELLENISLVAELKELRANPNKPARGICLEAMLTEGEGVLATLLVRDGTLHRGDVVLCGATYGRIRQMYDDMGKPLESAGPSIPVRITGLDSVPNADDPFYVVPEISNARLIAEKRRGRHLEESQTPRLALDLAQRLSQGEVAELKLILKADFRGSIEAIRKELEKLRHEEVSVRVLHAATGGISESDVQLALTSPQDTMILGFNVVPDDRARHLAEEKGVPIRLHNVIYELTADVRAALEGRLKPKQEIIHLGRAVVRDTFKISRVGTIAGCYVTQGTIKRSAKVRVIRDGVIIYPPHDRTAGLESLKRFKEDVSEVREGFECGLKIAGYDDIKVGDVIEAFRVEEVQRTLD